MERTKEKTCRPDAKVLIKAEFSGGQQMTLTR